MKTTYKATLIVAVACLAVLSFVAAASYLMVSPDSDPVTVSDQAVLSKVTVSSTVLTVGDGLTLTTTINDGTAGVTVTFYNQEDESVGTAVTNSVGTASLIIHPPTGTWTFYATATHP
jgi:hypothetical protein